MATVAYPGNLQTGQSGNADSTNTVQRQGGESNLRQQVLRINATAGATPTVTVQILGSVDGTTFVKVPYSPLAAVTGDWVTTNLTLTSTAITYYVLAAGQPWIFLKLNMSANTNMTLTSDLL